jgi:D-arabinose 1-dehydrogenase-like Zn-dependent alcohol dehydrogenase
MAAVQIAKLVGAIVIATGGSEEKLEAVRKEGAQHTICYETEPQFRQSVKALTPKGRGVDVVFDPVGGAPPAPVPCAQPTVHFAGKVSLSDVAASLKVDRIRIRIRMPSQVRCSMSRFAAVPTAAGCLWLALPRGCGQPCAQTTCWCAHTLQYLCLPMRHLCGCTGMSHVLIGVLRLQIKGMSVMGCRAGEAVRQGHVDVVERMRTLRQWAEEGKLRPHISHVFPLEETRAAFSLLWGRGVVGRVVVAPDSIEGARAIAVDAGSRL